MELELVLHKDYVQVIFENTSSTELCLWELWNSWGFWTLSFQIRSAENSPVFTVTHRLDEEWTINFPSIFIISPGKTRNFSIDLNDGEWTRDFERGDVDNKRLQVRASYKVDPPDAEEIANWKKYYEPDHLAHLLSVFTGSVVSDWVDAQPPHDWLFPSTQETMTSTIEVVPQIQPSDSTGRSAGEVRIDKFGIPMVYVPAGKFLMGSDPDLDENAREDEQPQHEIEFTKGFWIDQYIVTNEAYAAFVEAGGYHKQEFWTEAGWQWRQARQMEGPRDFDGFVEPRQPRVGITWFEAIAYSTWRGGRLPTEAEWEYAARGPQSLVYPWGNEWNPDFPRNVRSSDFAIDWGNQGKRESTLGGKRAVMGRSVDVGTKPCGKSWVNAYDMAGNAWEWCNNEYKPYPFTIPNEPIILDYNTRIALRGGSWDAPFTALRAACRWSFGPDVEGKIDYSLRPIFSEP